MQIATADSGVIQGSLKILTPAAFFTTVNSFLIVGINVLGCYVSRARVLALKPFKKIFRQQLFNKPSTHKNTQIHHSTKTSKS